MRGRIHIGRTVAVLLAIGLLAAACGDDDESGGGGGGGGGTPATGVTCATKPAIGYFGAGAGSAFGACPAGVAPPSHSAAMANSFCGFGLSAQSAAFRAAARRYPMTPASSSNSAASATSSVRVFIMPSYDHKSSLCNSFWDELP